MKIFLLCAAHQSVPGIVQKAFATSEMANVEAAIHLMLESEDESVAVAYVDDWEMVLGELLDRLDLEPDDIKAPFVEIEEMDVVGT